MKYPVIYIKGRGNHTARFTELTEGQMRIAGDIGAAMGKLMPLKDDHAFILYEQQGEEDIRSIRFLRSWFPGAGIILIISGQLTGEERRAYLGAGVNSAVPDDISRADFLRILQFMTDYTFVHKPVAGSGNDVELFRMPLWETGVRHRGIALGDPPALAPAYSRGRGRQTRQPGAGHL